MKQSDRTDYFFFSLDREWRFTFVSLSAGRVFNRSPSTLIGKSIWTLLSAYDKTTFYPVYDRALTGQEIIRVEEHLSLIGWVEHHIYPSRNGLSVYGWDITDSRRVETRLRQSEANLKAMINNTDTLIWSVDRQLRLLSYNKPFEKLVTAFYGRGLKEGVNIFQQLLTENVAGKLSRWNACFGRVLFGGTVLLEEQLFGNDFDCSLSPIRDGNKIIGISVFCHNSSERKKNERELAIAYKQISELKLMALRAAMNPHFIFNTLSSIQYYVANNDQASAIHYLTSFSTLIRNILDHSIQDTVPLQNELDMIQLYVNLQMMRFESKFDFELEVDDRIDAFATAIPSMLIQPFVENAISHGLANKSGRGKLVIRIRLAESRILCEVDDNGIGRDAAKNIRRRKDVNHKSMATVLTQERMRLMNATSNVSFEVSDKVENGKPDGTLVRIWLS